MKEKVLEFADVKDKIDPNNLVYSFKSSENEPKDFGNHHMQLKLIEDVKDGNMNPKEVLKNEARFELDLNEIKIGGKKSVDQIIQKRILLPFLIYEKKLFILLDYYYFIFFLLSEAKYKTKYGGFKLLIFKKMLQKLPIARAQVKAGNNSENEIRKIVCSLYQSKKITEKVYNNTIKSIQI